MNFRLPWTKKKEYAELESMERILDNIYKPVAPSREFKDRLRSQLIGKSKHKLFGLEIPNAKVGWMLAGGVVGTVFMLGNTILSISRFAKLVDRAGKKNESHMQAAV
jgi:hypothetical protein